MSQLKLRPDMPKSYFDQLAQQDEAEFRALQDQLEAEQLEKNLANQAEEAKSEPPPAPETDFPPADEKAPAASTFSLASPRTDLPGSAPSVESPPVRAPEEGGESDLDVAAPSLHESQVTPSSPPAKPRGLSRPDPLDTGGKPIPQHYKEIVIDANGQPRQAGADQQYGAWVVKLRSAAEKSLFLFAKGILNRHFLTETLHRPVCEFIQTVPPFRKLVLMPREHSKTAIISGALPLHIIVQPADGNIYFPGLEGSECRIMLAGENMRMAKKNLRVLEAIHSENKLFRTLWPHRCWEQPTRQAKVWNQEALIFPRQNEWPDPTIWALGVDGAVTGSRPNVMIKDDLISLEARNSDVVMQAAIDWHIASRALLDSYEVESGLQGLEFIIGTRWAVFDLYSYIQDNDPSVEIIDEIYHKIISNGQILWPEKHTLETIAQLRKEHRSMFYLLYLNSAADPELVDFDLNEVREFRLETIGDEKFIIFTEDHRDELLMQQTKRRTDTPRAPSVFPGTKLTKDFMRGMSQRQEYFRARFS